MCEKITLATPNHAHRPLQVVLDEVTAAFGRLSEALSRDDDCGC